MCLKFFKRQTPLFCFRHHHQRGRLRILTGILALSKIIVLGVSAFLEVRISIQDKLLYEKFKKEQQRTGRKSMEEFVEEQLQHFYSSVWTAAFCIAFVISYLFVLYAALTRSRKTLLSWISSCWFLPVATGVKLIYYIRVQDWYHYLAWGIVVVCLAYEVWVFYMYAHEIKYREETALGSAGPNITITAKAEKESHRHRGSLDVDSLGNEDILGDEDDAYVIAENKLLSIRDGKELKANDAMKKAPLTKVLE